MQLKDQIMQITIALKLLGPLLLSSSQHPHLCVLQFAPPPYLAAHQSGASRRKCPIPGPQLRLRNNSPTPIQDSKQCIGLHYHPLNRCKHRHHHHHHHHRRHYHLTAMVTISSIGWLQKPYMDMITIKCQPFLERENVSKHIFENVLHQKLNV